MNNKNKYSQTAFFCAAALLLNSANFTGPLSAVNYADLPLCLIALLIIRSGRGETLAACLALGFAIDSASGLKLPLHMAAYLIYSIAGARLSEIFYSPKSIPNAIAQAILASALEAALFASRAMLQSPARPDYSVIFMVITANAIVILCASAAASAFARNRRSAYTILAAGTNLKRPL